MIGRKARESKEGQEEAEDRGQHASSLTTLQVVDLGGVVMSPYCKYDSVPGDNVCSYATLPLYSIVVLYVEYRVSVTMQLKGQKKA